MLKAYHNRHPKPKTVVKLKEILQSIWDCLAQEPIDTAAKEFWQRPKAWVAAGGGHFKRFQW